MQAEMHEIGGRAVRRMMFHQIQPGAEMIARAAQHTGAHTIARQGAEDLDQLVDGGRVQRVALGRAVQGDGGDAQIIDVYAYDEESGAVVASGKKSWSDSGTQEYRDLTGE